MGHKIVNRSVLTKPAAVPKNVFPEAKARTRPIGIKTLLKVSSPQDPAEREADLTAKKVMRTALPEGPNSVVRTSDFVQRKSDGHSQVESKVQQDIEGSMAGGSPLPGGLRGFMEPRFCADFSKVMVHTGENSARLSSQLNARAFTIGNHIFFGRDAFDTESHEGRELVAHELTHTIQQGGTGRRIGSEGVMHQSPVMVQRLGVSDALDYFADKANMIPGFRVFTIILGLNPINMSRVEGSAANILRALVEFIPGGGLIVQALDNHGIFDRVAAWVRQEIRSLGVTGSGIRQALINFLNSLNWRDVFHLGSVWDRAKRIFTDPIDRIISFARRIVTTVIRFIKEAILRPLARLAEGTRGYDLLKAVLGQDPITGEAVPRTADTLIGGFMKLIGQEEIWNNMRRANAVARAWAWFQGAMASLIGFVRQVPSLFIQALASLELVDIVLVPRAFIKVGRVFAGFLGRFISWAGSAVWNLLEIIFEVVAPRAVPYLKRAAGAFRTILRNPIGFVANLVRAGRFGFQQFAGNILTHLRNSLVQWLTGTLGPTIYIPRAFEIREIIKFVLSVLGLTWQNIRQKLVRAVGERAVAALETGLDIVVALVREGPAAAWEKIKEQLSNLKELVIDEVMAFVRTRIVQAAVTRLLGMLSPAGAFIQAIIAIYNTIMFFIERLQQIIQVATSFIDSIAAIAGGMIISAANRVEQTLAGLLTLAISFLARIAGLGRVADAVMNVINRVRAPIDRALDRVVQWVVDRGRKLLSRLLGGDPNAPPQERLNAAMDEAVGAVNRLGGSAVGQVALRPVLLGIRTRHNLQSLEAIAEGGRWVIEGRLNPTSRRATSKLIAEGTGADNFRSRITYHAPDPRRGGKRMVADPLGPDHPTGTKPSSVGAPPIWASVNERRNGRRLYVLGHLLNMRLGGSGDIMSNLTPITFSANATHEARAESGLKDRVNRERKWVYYEVTVTYPSSRQATPSGVEPDEGWLATSFTAKWQPLEPKVGKSDELERKSSMESVTVNNVGGGSYPQT
jgi:hypothetical protein